MRTSMWSPCFQWWLIHRKIPYGFILRISRCPYLLWTFWRWFKGLGSVTTSGTLFHSGQPNHGGDCKPFEVMRILRQGILILRLQMSWCIIKDVQWLISFNKFQKNCVACDIVCRMSDEYQSHLRSLLTYVLVNNWNFLEYIPVK